MDAFKKLLSFHVLNMRVYSTGSRYLAKVKFSHLVVIFAIVFFAYCYYYRITKLDNRKSKSIVVKVEPRFIEPENLMQTTGCHIPYIEASDYTMVGRAHYPDTVKPCSNLKKYILLLKNSTHIFLDKYEAERYQAVNVSLHLWCCYESIQQPLMVLGLLSEKVNYTNCINFETSIKVKPQDDVVRVTCFVGDQRVYRNLFIFTHKKKTYFEKSVKMQSLPTYNVIVLGVDSISRPNLHRTMPKTISYLQALGAIELLGHNNVGEYSMSSLVPLLLGLDHTEIIQYCISFELVENECMFIWNQYMRQGFRSAVGHTSITQSFDDYQRFLNGPPPDYQLHIYQRDEPHEQIMLQQNLCLKQKAYFEVLIDYIRDLTRSLHTSKLFGFFWEATMNIQYINYPNMMDNSYHNLFEQLNRTKYLEKTVLIFMSNHGFRSKRIRSELGQTEIRMPFVYILTPPSFKQIYRAAYKNLLQNRERLTTPFDIYKTLVDLSNVRRLQNHKIQDRGKRSYLDRGISLFLPIPETRTCTLASVNMYWCNCRWSTKLSKRDQTAVNLANFLIDHINRLLIFEKKCTELSVKKILAVKQYRMVFQNGLTEYVVVLRAKPGKGVFMARLQVQKSWTKVVELIRLNDYKLNGCSSSPKLAMFCFCKQ